MKLPSVMWSVILFSLRPNNENQSSKEIYNITKTAHLDKYEYLKEDYPYSDTIWDICNDLKEIDIEYNENLKEAFFHYWKNIEYQDKLRIFKNVDMPKDEKFTPEIKKYLVKNLMEYPNINELHRFRKEMSQEHVKKALKNFYEQINFYKIKNQPKEDYWENHISGKEEEKLLDLIEISGMRKEELTEFNKIGFFNKTRQAKFNRLNDEESNLSLLESVDKQVYLLTIKCNEVVLLKENDKLGANFLMMANKYIHKLIRNTIEEEKIEMISVTNVNPLKFIVEDKEIFNKAVKKKNAVIDWIEDNQNLIIEKVRNHIQNNKSLVDLHEETKELADKVILKDKLENNLTGKENKIKPIKKI